MSDYADGLLVDRLYRQNILCPAVKVTGLTRTGRTTAVTTMALAVKVTGFDTRRPHNCRDHAAGSTKNVLQTTRARHRLPQPHARAAFILANRNPEKFDSKSRKTQFNFEKKTFL